MPVIPPLMRMWPCFCDLGTDLIGQFVDSRTNCSGPENSNLVGVLTKTHMSAARIGVQPAGGRARVDHGALLVSGSLMIGGRAAESIDRNAQITRTRVRQNSEQSSHTC